MSNLQPQDILKSSVRQRIHTFPREVTKLKRRVSWSDDVKDEDPFCSYFPVPWYLLLLYLLLLFTIGGVSLYFYTKLPDPVIRGVPNQFHALRARRHMEELTALGVRNVGSDANEIYAKNLIISKVEEIKANASKEIEIEISVQNPTGNFFLDFLGGITQVYQNITNIAVKVHRKGVNSGHTFMVNAHYDSAIGSVAASDDAMSCGTMLEVIRCLSSNPNPLLAEHGLIFLFNGAEETILQASHGFITQHPWAKSIRGFLNLEAAGAGGKEIVFQTGPDHPWIARLYSKSVPHPHASIVAQEVFQSGIIPSDTDFRVFRDFGHIPGIDTAYYTNGYIYHTEYDIPSAIPNGSIQRAGENILALLREVANSPLLSNLEDNDRHGKVVFFDILGLMTVVYPEKVAMALNFGVALIFLLTMFKDINWNHSKNSAEPTPRLFLLSFGVMVLSWLAGVLVAVAIAALLTLLGCSMVWFSQPLLIIPLYMLPSFLAISEVHAQFINKSHYLIYSLEKSSFLSIQFLWTVLLAILTSLRICSAFAFFIMVTFQLIFRTLLFEFLISSELKKSHVVYKLSYILCSVFAFLPFVFLLHFPLGIMQLFIPIMGRSGSILPPDLLIGGLTAVLLSICTPYMICVLAYSASKEFKKKSREFLLVISGLAIVMAGAGLFHPYSIDSSEFPTPKRFFLMHTDRTFHALDGSVSNEDSRIYMFPFDYLGLKPIADVSPVFRDAKLTECEGMYCREPVYLPLRHLLNSWYLPSTRLVGREGADLTLFSSIKTSENSRNYTLQAKFPQRCSGLVGTTEGVRLKAWSFGSSIPPPNPCPGSHKDRGCHFIFQARGFGNGEFNFWIETEGDVDVDESLRIAITAHHFDPPQSETADLSNLINSLPKWVTTISWTTIHKEWIF